MSTPAKLTVTSYAILGLLAIKPWTTYELTQQMRRSLNSFWPRAESKLYEEPKKLVAHGLATAEMEQVGQRVRTVFTITTQGRRELAQWLSTPPETPVLQAEPLLRVFLAENGRKQDLLTALETVRVWAEKQRTEDAAIAHGYLSNEGPFPERMAQLVLVGRYLSDFAEMNDRWARWASEVVSEWPDDMHGADPAWDALRQIAAFRPAS